MAAAVASPVIRCNTIVRGGAIGNEKVVKIASVGAVKLFLKTLHAMMASERRWKMATY